MREIAEVIADVLHATAPGVIASGRNAGRPSQVRYVLDEHVSEAARRRVIDLLDRHPLYPEIDLSGVAEPTVS